MDLSTISSICIFGDSIVDAHTDPMRGWPGRLKHMLTEANETGAVYALGIPGNTLQDVANRFDVEAAARHPELVIIAVGTADSPSDFSDPTLLATFEAAFRALLAMVREVTPRTLVLTPPNIDEDLATYGFTNRTLQPYVEAIKSLALAEEVPYVDLFGSLSNEDFDRDGLHPTASGHEKLFETILGALAMLP
jgi:lysophospholipase L1-like esterase